MQVKAFLQLFGVAAYVSLIFIVILVMRGYGLGQHRLIFWYNFVFVPVFAAHDICFFKKICKTFQDVDHQLSMLLSDQVSEIQLPEELASVEQKLHLLKEAMEKTPVF